MTTGVTTPYSSEPERTLRFYSRLAARSFPCPTIPVPARSFERLIRGISEGRWADLAGLYAEDAVVDQPLVSTAPRRIEGRETIRAHFLGAAEMDLRLVAHHIVADGWSVGLLLRDLAVAYRERSAGRVPDLPALPVQPADYAVWEAAQLTTDALAPDLEYWRAEFADPPRPLDLPTEQPRTRGIAAPAATRRTRVGVLTLAT